jgi:hypothetical protein
MSARNQSNLPALPKFVRTRLKSHPRLLRVKRLPVLTAVSHPYRFAGLFFRHLFSVPYRCGHSVAINLTYFLLRLGSNRLKVGLILPPFEQACLSTLARRISSLLCHWRTGLRLEVLRVLGCRRHSNSEAFRSKASNKSRNHVGFLISIIQTIIAQNDRSLLNFGHYIGRRDSSRKTSRCRTHPALMVTQNGKLHSRYPRCAADTRPNGRSAHRGRLPS